jgi:GntR family transcriptional regulator
VALKLNDRSVSQFDDRPLYRQLADTIREQIRAGALRPGDPLPSEGEIARLTGLSRTAVRDALDVLAGEGAIVKRAGAAARVATPPPVRHMATSRYADELARLRALCDPAELYAHGDAALYGAAEHPPVSAFTEDHGVAWDLHRVEATYTKDAATGDDAARLDLVEGTAVLRRQLVKYVADQPVQIQESVIPLELVEGTPVEDPSRQPWPGGTIAELYSIGLVVTRVVEEATARTPTTGDRQTLEIAAGPVLVVTRIFYAEVDGEERPVEASTVVVPASRVILRFETDLR